MKQARAAERVRCRGVIATAIDAPTRGAMGEGAASVLRRRRATDWWGGRGWPRRSQVDNQVDNQRFGHASETRGGQRGWRDNRQRRPARRA
jgi:hypothetical protein